MANRLPAVLFTSFWLAVSAAAQVPPDQRFLVESIVVSGVESDAARNIVTDQSLLVPGRSYSEQEIRDAVYRVRRLPFVLGADYSLREGKAPESKQVVIAVDSNRPTFLEADVTETTNGDAGQDATDWSAAVTGGGRWFLGSLGLASVTAQGFDGAGVQSAEVAYTRYGLFGRGGAARLSLSSDVGRSDADIHIGSLVVAVPIVGNHSLRANADWFEAKSSASVFRSRSESEALGLSWDYDSTADPLFPTQGRSASGGARYSRSKQSFRGADFSSSDTSHDVNLLLTGRQVRPLTGRQSVSVSLTGTWDRATITSLSEPTKQASASLQLGHALDLRRHVTGTGGIDLRWESSLEVVASRFDSFFSRERSTDARLATGLVFRNGWALTRLTFSYVDNLHRDERFTGPRI